MKNLAVGFVQLFFTALIVVAAFKFKGGASSLENATFGGISGVGQTILSGGSRGPYSPTSVNQSSH